MGDTLSVLDAKGLGGATDLAAGSEGVLLSQLIQLLSQRPKHTMLLSDIGAILSVGLRQRAKDQGGLKAWIERYSSLFSVSGAAGVESVQLILGTGKRTESVPVASTRVAGANDAQGSTTLAKEMPAEGDAPDDGQDGGFDEEVDGLSALQLRGLPYRATVDDIRAFLGEHAAHLSEDNPIHLIVNRDGRPSGFARVSFNSPESANNCRDELHLRSMNDRYVEVFLYSDRPSRGRSSRRGSQDEGPLEVGPDVPPIPHEEVIRECRSQMVEPKKRRLLLSMLGVSLSPGARAYLKQSDQGLKSFLAQYPHEFSVDGTKGSEYVNYTPIQLADVIDGLVGASGATLPPVSTDESFKHASPKPTRTNLDPTSANASMKTPSNWGTPALGSQSWNPGTSGASSTWLPPWPGASASLASEAASPWPAPLPWSMGGGAFYPGAASWPWDPGTTLDALKQPDSTPSALANNQTKDNVVDIANSAPKVASGSSASASIGSVMASGVGGVDYATAVRLRGLPFSSSEQDVLAFFAQHEVVDRVADGPNAVKLLLRSNGRSSGQAVVQMRSKEDTEVAQQVLAGQMMGTRYIEVFLYNADGNPVESSVTAGIAHQNKQATTHQGQQQQPPTLAGQFSADSALGTAAGAAAAAAAAQAAFQVLSNPWAGAPWQMPGSSDPSGCERSATDSAATAAAAAAATAAMSAGTGWEAFFDLLSPQAGMPMFGNVPFFGSGFGGCGAYGDLGIGTSLPAPPVWDPLTAAAAAAAAAAGRGTARTKPI